MRSLLLVPADDETKLAAALASAADAIVLDLVGVARSEAARAVAADLLGRGLDRAVLVRVNALDSGFIDADLDAIMPAAPTIIVLGDSLGAASVQHCGVKLAVHEALRGLPDGATRILPIAASSRGILAMQSYRGCSARLAGLGWGGADIAIGAQTARADCAWTSPFMLARSLTLFAAAAAGVPAFDAPYEDLADDAGLIAEARAARRDGFGGKIAIDASQVGLINAAFAR
jgi:citrate lyase subunit beta/citryl-CoA lyase